MVEIDSNIAASFVAIHSAAGEGTSKGVPCRLSPADASLPASRNEGRLIACEEVRLNLAYRWFDVSV